MNKVLALAITLFALWQSSFVHALSLGELDVQSKVNEPLNATIELKGASALSASQILVQLAGPEVFRQAQIDRPFFLSGLKFDVENSGGSSRLRLSTEEKITEPYLNFIIEVRWPSGRVMREYLALLDLPVYSSDSPSAISAPVAQKPVNEPVIAAAEPAPAEATQPAPARSSSSVSVAQDQPPQTLAPAPVPSAAASGDSQTEYTVQSGDTAWEIAERFTAEDGNVSQMLYALNAQNQQAFIDGDVNRIRRGAVLRIPEQSSVNNKSIPEAVRWQQQQHANWRAANKSAPQTQALDGSRRVASAAKTVAAPDGQLTLTTQIGGESHESRAGKSLQEGNGSGGSEQLVTALEQLDKTRLEKEALDDRYESLQQRFQQLEKLVTLKNAQLAELASSIEQSDQLLSALEENDEVRGEMEELLAGIDTANTSIDGDIDKAPVPEGGSDTGAIDLADNSAEASPDATLAELTDAVSSIDESTELSEAGTLDEVLADEPAASSAVSPAPVVKRESATAESGLLAFLPAFIKDNLMLLGGALLAIVAALGGAFVFLKRRAGLADNEEFSWNDAVADGDDAFAAIEIDDPVHVEDDDQEEFVDAPSDFSGERAELADVDEESATVAGMLAEVDIYLSYGRHEQAVHALEQLIEDNEGNTDIHFKLIEVHRAGGDAESAQAAAQVLLGIDPSAQSRINDLLNDVSDSAAGVEVGSQDATENDGFAGFDQPVAEQDDDSAFDFTLSGDSDLIAGEDALAQAETMDFDAQLDAEDQFSSMDFGSEDFTNGENELLAEAASVDGQADDLEAAELEQSAEASGELDGLEFDTVAESELSFDEIEKDLAAIDLETDELEVLDGSDSELGAIEDEINAAYGELGISLDSGDSALQDSDLDAGGELDADNEINADSEIVAGDTVAASELSVEPENGVGESFELEESTDVADADSLDAASYELSGDLLDLEISSSEEDVASIVAASDTPQAVTEDQELPVDSDSAESAEATLTDADLEAEYQSATALLEVGTDGADSAELASDDSQQAEAVAATGATPETNSSDADDDIQLGDAVATKLDLARAYLEMGDLDGAKDVLDEVLEEGDDRQQKEANVLMQKIA